MTPERAEEVKALLKDVLEEHSDDHKRVLKEALTEWLDEKWADFGKWTFRGVAAALFSALIYVWAKSKGVI